MKEKKGSFSGSIGFVLAAAGSAVGVGNIWRFPYLCAKDGGVLFMIIYLYNKSMSHFFIQIGIFIAQEIQDTVKPDR